MVNISVLVSGGGTNLQALIDKVESGELAGAEIVQVISSREGVFALERAAKAGRIRRGCSKLSRRKTRIWWFWPVT